MAALDGVFIYLEKIESADHNFIYNVPILSSHDAIRISFSYTHHPPGLFFIFRQDNPVNAATPNVHSEAEYFHSEAKVLRFCANNRRISHVNVDTNAWAHKRAEGVLMDTIAQKAVSFFISHGAGHESNRDIYEYGVVITLSFLVNAAVAVILGFAFSLQVEMLVFFIPFAIHRSLSGGYHAKTWWGCLIMSGLVMVAVVFLLKLQARAELFPVSAILWILSIKTTFAFAPVENANRPLSDAEKSKFRKYSRIYTPLCAFIGAVFFVLKLNRLSLCVALALGASAITQLIAILLNKRKGGGMHNEK